MEPETTAWPIFFEIAHLVGIAIGAGGAFVADLMFLKSVKDEKISKTEFGFLQLGSRLVWLGLLILILSGIGLFLLKPEELMHSSKFLAKMTIVGIILTNGFFFYRIHLPRFQRHTGEHFPSSDEFVRSIPFILTSGAISLVSWLAAIALGALRSLPYSYWQIIAVYAALVIGAALLLLLFKRKIFRL